MNMTPELILDAVIEAMRHDKLLNASFLDIDGTGPMMQFARLSTNSCMLTVARAQFRITVTKPPVNEAA